MPPPWQQGYLRPPRRGDEAARSRVLIGYPELFDKYRSLPCSASTPIDPAQVFSTDDGRMHPGERLNQDMQSKAKRKINTAHAFWI